jgi:hypothetical protein
MKQISLRLDEELLAAINEARGQTPRETWIRDVLIAAVALPEATSVSAQYGAAVHAHRPIPSVRGHHPRCDCPVCRPPKGGKP